MSANDILDVLNIQRDDSAQPAKKKQKVDQPTLQKGGMARELYNLLGPNTPPVNMNMGISRIKDRKQKVSPWTRISFRPNKKNPNAPTFYHWQKGSRELLEKDNAEHPYVFDKFSVSLDIPELVDEETYDKLMEGIKERELEIKKERRRRAKEKRERERENAKKTEEKSKKDTADSADAKKDASEKLEKEKAESLKPASESKESKDTKDSKNADEPEEEDEDAEDSDNSPEWSYEETKLLFDLCRDYELKWHAISDRFPSECQRSMEDLKEQFYRMSASIMKHRDTGNPSLLESLDAFSKYAETDRKKFLESLLKRTPAEIAEEESLVIEARRFELAAKKMLVERSHLLSLLDSPQTSQSVQQYLSSQGLTNLYNNLMILDKHQKKKLQQKAASGANDPVPPPIPVVASSSYKRDRGFQTHLQQYLSGLVKLNPQVKGEPSAVQQLLSKRLTTKEEEAYGLHYHANERLTPGVILRSTQKLPGLQQRQSVFKSVNTMLQELDIPTAGGTTWKPVMPTRKTMAKYDELIRAVVALLDVKRGKDKLEAEIELIKAQRGLQ